MAEIMKDSGIAWLGKIPENWDVYRLKNVIVDSMSGEVIDKTYWNTGDELLYTCQRVPMFSSFNCFPKIKRTLGNDLLLTRNATPYVFIPEPNSIYSNVVQRIVINRDNDKRFIRYSIQLGSNEEVVNGDTIPSYNMEVWKNIHICKISFSEQKMIADFLDEKCAEIDKLSKDIQKQIQCLVEYKSCLIHRTLLRYDGNEPVMKPIKYVATCNDESLSNNTPADYEFDYVDIGSVLYGSGITKKERMSFGNSPSRARRIVRCGDTIVSTVRTYLKAVAKISSEDLDYPTIVSTGFAVLRPKRNAIDSDYLAFVIQSNDFVSEVEAVSVGVSYPAINTSALMNIKIPLYDLTTQNKIASYLDEKCKRVDLLISAENEQLARLANYKKSIIYEYVTGKKRVKGVN